MRRAGLPCRSSFSSSSARSGRTTSTSTPPAWAAVVLLSFFIFEGKARPALALGAWLAGTATSLVFVNYANLFGNVAATTSFFNNGLITGLHGADVSGLVSVGVAAALYWAGLRWRPA